MGWLQVLTVGTEYEFMFVKAAGFKGVVESMNDTVVTVRTKPNGRRKHFEISELRMADETGAHVCKAEAEEDASVSTRIFDPETHGWQDVPDEAETE